MMGSGLTALGVHIFAGGFTCGLKSVGFHVLGHLEDTSYGVASARLNWPDLDVRVGEESWRPEEFTGRVDFLYSNPPCAIFSTAGICSTRGREAWRSDPRLGCWHRAFGVFEVVRPRVFALESVCQAMTKGREVVDDFTARALAMGYSVKRVLLDSKWTGVPQSRKRFFFLAHLSSVPLKLEFDFSRELATVGEILGKVDDPGYVSTRDGDSFSKRCYRKCLPLCQPGEKLRNVFDRLRWPEAARAGDGQKNGIPGRPGFLVQRLHPDRQMGAFIGDVFIHPSEHRRLGVAEMKVLCGYPPDFMLEGPPRRQPALLARAVLPPVGRWLGLAVRQALAQRKRGSLRVTVESIDLRNRGRG